MKAYGAILVSRFLALLQYRSAAIAGAGTQLFFGLVRLMIFEAFYQSTAGSQPLTYDQVISYVWLGQALFALTIPRMDSDVATMIRTGDVAYELTRPMDLYTLWFVRSFSGRATPLLMRGVPIGIIAGLFFGLHPPDSPVAAILFVMSLLAALLLASSLILLANVSLFWTISGEGIFHLVPVLVWFFCGIVIPLPLLPPWMQTFISLLPFRGLLDTPLRLYIGDLNGPDAMLAIVAQGVWILALVFIGRVTLSRGLRRLVIQGG